MDFFAGLQRAMEYIEGNLDDGLDIRRAAELAGTTAYHFQRAFALMTGKTVGEYVRARRLTLAVSDIRRGMKVIDVAVKYGYDSPDSFARAFARFHGMPPSEARRDGARVNSCSPLRIKVILEGGTMLDYKIVDYEGRDFLGYRRRFEGAPYGEQRNDQEENMFVTTRAHQWMLRGMSRDLSPVYGIITDQDDEGYDFWIAYENDEWAFTDAFDPGTTGIDFMDKFGFERLSVPAGPYVVFRTACNRHPVDDYMRLRERIASEWLPGAGYTLRDAPELSVNHWYNVDKEKRYVEIWLPIER